MRSRAGVSVAAFVLVFPALMLATGVGLAGTAGLGVVFSSQSLPAVARQIPMGGSLRLLEVPLEKKGKPAELVLERVRVFSEDAEIVVHGPEGDTVLPPPDNVYLRGSVSGRDGALVMLTVRAKGEVRGLITDHGRFWIIGSEAFGERSAQLVIRELDSTEELPAHQGYRCGSDELPTLEDLGHHAGASEDAGSSTGHGARKASYTARVAIESDYELFQRFGNVSDTTDYAGDIISYASGVYDAEVDTSLIISHVSLWSSNNDPWTQTSSACLLMELGRYWNTNNTGVSRTITHYMSGKSTGGGIAWVGVLCRGGFGVSLSQMGLSCSGLTPDSDSYGGGYGYTGSMSGSFNIDNPQVVWDLMAVTHEIGHNFNSPHTHCYGGIGGNANPVDQCYGGECGQGGCHCGGATLPCGSPGAGCGTIMSYCHLLSGGLGNTAYTFGEGHPYGTAPERVPDRMNSHVVSTASFNPGCLELVLVDLLFSDGFESGDMTTWSSSVP